jgi:hypothetical protein
MAVGAAAFEAAGDSVVVVVGAAATGDNLSASVCMSLV